MHIDFSPRISASSVALTVGLLVGPLLALPAQAQMGGYVETLALGSQGVLPLRSFDPDTRARNRYAVVIGNSTYESGSVDDLPNAVSDARVVAEFFRSQGYIVSQNEDVTKREFEAILRRIMFDADDDTEVVLFYAGHGFQIGNENYLVPVDADLDSVYDLPFEVVSLGSLVGIVGSRARLMVVMLDACRNNPFAGRSALTLVGSDLRETRTGFASQAAPLNSMLVYSTAPGSVAYDGEGDNSPFAASFIEEATVDPDMLIKQLFENVRRSVYERTQGNQIPWDSSTLIEPASFGLGAAISRPIAVSSTGTGVDRAVARLGDTADVTGEDDASEVADAALLRIMVEAPFAGEVAIGPILSEALQSPETVRILTGPQTGHLTLMGADGIIRDIVGTELSAADLANVLLVNRSVQIPAAQLGETPLIEDGFTVQTGGDTVQVALDLTPNACDFEAGDLLDPDGMGITRYANEIRPEEALAACEAAVAAEPEVGRFHYQLGRALLALRRHDEARAAFERARDLGHVRAWQALGQSLFNEPRTTGGLNRQQASEEVLQLYARGSVEGDPFAMYALGWQLLRYGPTEESQIEGYDLVMRSLEVGHTFAMNAMAQLYLDEEGEYYDPERGIRYLTESAAREDIYGYNALGLVYWRGRGGEAVDLARAFDLFTLAAEEGHPTAPYNLARMYRDGEAPGGANPEKAVEWFLVALDQGHALSAAHAVYAILNGTIPGFSRFDAAAIAARGAVLLNANGAEDAQAQLDAMGEDDLIGGLQVLLAGMGGAVEVTGTFDAATEAALAALSPEAASAGTAMDRIRLAAGVYWERNPFRVDLY